MSEKSTSSQRGGGVLHEEELVEPPLYRVILHNDDVTTMDFVVALIVRVFHRSREEAERLMWQVHEQGSAVCGVYPHELAESRVAQVHDLARQAGFPLRCSMEQQ